MVSKISEGIKVSVETFFQQNHSNAVKGEYTFAYRITIENHNDFPVRLRRRHWYIFDSNGENREVDGEGVIGKQPVIHPGGDYQYVSGCSLHSEMGKMWGIYQMEDSRNNKLFEVYIPAFEMIAPFKNN